MKMTDQAIHRPVTTAMIFLAVVLLGFVSLRQLSVDLLPDIGYPRLSVVTRFAGVAPEEMETLITAPLEAAVSRIPGLRGIDSISREGVSFLSLEFAWGIDMDFALLRAREELGNARKGLPLDAENPVILPLDPGTKPIMILAVTGQGASSNSGRSAKSSSSRAWSRSTASDPPRSPGEPSGRSGSS